MINFRPVPNFALKKILYCQITTDYSIFKFLYCNARVLSLLTFCLFLIIYFNIKRN
ncbi:hypothetical protein C2G38_2090689 [Gigaspora rosea]|uniref:Uncharacterized protein n=1 Tax=Gigaspora rosea TaxID=44941 RepID=A0A397V4F0_9GLOM|nr:hypothetical protein C2G38_2090689 [Gigaspora rosea]